MPHVDQQSTSHTNCIVTLVWADGVMRTPPIMFTSDRIYKVWKRKTPRRINQESAVQAALTEFNVDAKQIVYIPDTKYYTYERAEIIRAYLKRVRNYIFCDSVIFSDNARMYLSEEQPITTSLRANTARYPAEVHQYMSPNDNHLHGAAKAKWRKFRRQKLPGVKGRIFSDVCLLGQLTHIKSRVIRGFFDINLFLGNRPLSVGRCKNHIMGVKNGNKARFFITKNCWQNTCDSWI